MTIFPTHKTDLKTTLSKQEVLERLERNNIYTIGFYYELIENGKTYTLNLIRKSSGRNLFASAVNFTIDEKSPHTIINLSFFPLKSASIIVLVFSLLFFVISSVIVIYDIVNTGFSLGALLPLSIGVLFYTFCMLMFSFEVLSVRKQIEETIEAEIHEITEDEMSKLQKWYEKKR